MERDKEKFLVKIVPGSYPEQESWLGCMRGKGRITGDIISPAEDTDIIPKGLGRIAGGFNHR